MESKKFDGGRRFTENYLMKERNECKRNVTKNEFLGNASVLLYVIHPTIVSYFSIMFIHSVQGILPNNLTPSIITFRYFYFIHFFSSTDVII